MVRRSEGILAASGNKLTGNKHALPPLKDAEKYNVAAASSSELSPAAAASIPFRYTPGPFGYSEYLGARNEKRVLTLLCTYVHNAMFRYTQSCTQCVEALISVHLCTQ